MCNQVTCVYLLSPPSAVIWNTKCSELACVQSDNLFHPGIRTQILTAPGRKMSRHFACQLSVPPSMRWIQIQTKLPYYLPSPSCVKTGYKINNLNGSIFWGGFVKRALSLLYLRHENNGLKFDSNLHPYQHPPELFWPELGLPSPTFTLEDMKRFTRTFSGE